jgi:agarase
LRVSGLAIATFWSAAMATVNSNILPKAAQEHLPFRCQRIVQILSVFILSLSIFVSISDAGQAIQLLTQTYSATGFFRVQNDNGVWWFIDPEGRRFISKGVTTVQYAQDNIQGTNRSPYRETNQAKYGSIANWQKAIAPRLMKWGFNTLGAWSDAELTTIEVNGKYLAYSPNLNLGASFVGTPRETWLRGEFPNVFDPKFEIFSRQKAQEQCGPQKNDPRILGWFTDNELRWAADWRDKDELLTVFLELPASSPGKRVAVDLLRNRHVDVAKLNADWETDFRSWADLLQVTEFKQPVDTFEFRITGRGSKEVRAFVADSDAFLELVAEQYFRITTEAIKVADPNHLIFGPRFAYLPAKPVVTAAAKYLNAISFNSYSLDPSGAIDQYSAFNLPVVIGEFSFVSDDSGLPNTSESMLELHMKNQKERALAFRNYVSAALKHPNLIGYHWFEHVDQPKEGRFDGQNANYGIVDIEDQPYSPLVEMMAEVNADAEQIHASAPYPWYPAIPPP